jgi:hypothetical protein
MPDEDKNTTSQTYPAKIQIVEKSDKAGSDLIDYRAPDGNSTFSIAKSELFPEIYQVTPSAYPLTNKEIRGYLDFLSAGNEQQLFIEILRCYAFSAFIPALVSCRSLLETIVDKVCSSQGIALNIVENNGSLKPKWLTEKIRDLGVGNELENFMLFNNDFAKKAVHEIFQDYGRVFDKTKTTILLSCTLLIINEIRQKYAT